MILKSAALKNFRLTEKETVDFSSGVNLLYGKNAEGKTNLLEAIYYFSRGKSFRGGKDADIVRFGSDGFSIGLEFYSEVGKRYETLEYRFFENERKRLSNGVKISAAEAVGKFHAILFCPDHLQIIKSSPSARREFLNIALSQRERKYVSLLTRHKKLTEGKNAVLKGESPTKKNLVEAYNDELSEVSGEICILRREYIKMLEKSVFETISDISGGREKTEIIYKCDIPAEISRLSDAKIFYRELFEREFERELCAKMCLFGIQRDDIEFLVNGREAKQFASQGQQRSIALALKIGEGEILKETFGESPVYLFDDVLGELDEERKKYVLSRTKQRQVIVTSCEGGEYDGLSGLKKIKVEKGRYYPIG